MKKIRRWISVIIVAVSVISLVLGITGNIHDVSAAEVTSTDVDNVKTRILYKAFYSGLDKCYQKMVSPIAKNQENVFASFSTTTYFERDALSDEFLKFPWGMGSGTSTTTSCPNLISGWKTSWPASWFTSKGTFDGLAINAGAEVPTGGWDSTPEKMGNFLSDIGYTKSEIGDDSLRGRKCFYYQMKLTDNYKASRGISNDPTYETLDFCVKMDGNNIAQGSDAIITLHGEQDILNFHGWDNGHYKSDSNTKTVVLDFNTDSTYAPGWETIPSDIWKADETEFAGKTYFEAGIDNVWLYSPDNARPSILEDSIIKYNDSLETCVSLGYSYCAQWAHSYWEFTAVRTASLTPIDNPSITLSNLQSSIKKLIEGLKLTDDTIIFDSISNAIPYEPLEIKYTKAASSSKFMNYLLGDTSKYNNGKFTDAETYVLYYSYLKDFYNISTLTRAPDSGESVQVDWLQSDGTFAKVYLYAPNKNSTGTRYVLNSAGKWDGVAAEGWYEIATRLSKIDVESAFGDVDFSEDIVDPDITNPPSNEPDNPPSPSCFNEGASLGWILCPVIQAVGNATEGIYDFIVENWLDIGANEMKADPHNGVYKGWMQFRDFANIIFVILLIIVIFSQVTGFGLSNYGVKKALPTLIMVAVLVNLSFFICQIAVDTTNILGDQLRKIFNGIEIYGKGASVESIVSGMLNTLGLTSLIIGGGIAIGISGGIQLGALLIPLIMGLITGVISVVFFFLILAVRKAGVFILIVLSPVAIVCYALPNTKKVFDRWLKIFSSLLLVYPICGLLMGAGNMMSEILLTVSDGFFTALTAMLIQVVPFFFVPTLVKNSMTALGNLGSKISAMGSRLGHSASGAFGKSDAAKRARISANNWGTTKGRELASRANNRLRNMRGIGRAVRSVEDRASNSKLGKLARSNRDRRAAQNWAQYKKQRLEDAGASLAASYMSEDSIAREEATMERKFQEQLIDDGMNNIINSGKYMTSAGEQSLDINDPGAIDSAYQTLIDDLAADPDNLDAQLRAKSMMRLLSSRGGRGRSLAAERIYHNVFNGTAKQRSAARMMAQQMMLDGKLMAQYHANDPATEQFITDVATNSIGDKKRRDYAIMSAGKLRLNTVGDLDDTFYSNLKSLDVKSDEYGNILQTLEQAVRNVQTGGAIKDSDIKTINELRRNRYAAFRDKWISDNGGINNIISHNNIEGFDDNGNLVAVSKVNEDGQLLDAHNNILYNTYDVQAGKHGDAMLVDDVYSALAGVDKFKNVSRGINVPHPNP